MYKYTRESFKDNLKIMGVTIEKAVIICGLSHRSAIDRVMQGLDSDKPGAQVKAYGVLSMVRSYINNQTFYTLIQEARIPTGTVGEYEVFKSDEHMKIYEGHPTASIDWHLKIVVPKQEVLHVPLDMRNVFITR